MLKISIGLNLVLAGGLIFMLHQKPVATPAPRAVAENLSPMAVPAAAAPQIVVQAEPKPFRWSQLLSTNDYRVFVKNLRAIGCPEATLRAIVTADVNAACLGRIIALEKEISDFAASSWTNQLAGVGKDESLKAQLRLIPYAETLEIQYLLGLKPAPAETVAALASTSQPISDGGQPSAMNQRQARLAAQKTAASAGETPASNPTDAEASAQMASAAQPQAGTLLPPAPKSAALPLVFQPVDSAALNLTPSQMQVVNDLRQEFAATLNGSSQNPQDPAYQQVWQQAQTQSDAVLQVNLGYNRYMEYWAMRYQQSLATTQ